MLSVTGYLHDTAYYLQLFRSNFSILALLKYVTDVINGKQRS